MESLEEAFKYDVAFSFLAEDEELATKLNGLLEGRLPTFIYSSRQKEVAGTDGEKVFGQVFGQQARVVVVLYRSTWGTTSWTRIEEIAIKNRGFDDGYDFVLLIPLEKPASCPKWIPRNRLWIGLDRFGLDGAAGAIEARVQEAGGNPKEEGPAEYAARIARTMAARGKVKALLDSEPGVKLAREEIDKLFGILKTTADGVNSEQSALKLAFKNERNTCTVAGRGFYIWIEWVSTYGNSLSNSCLYVGLWKQTGWEDKEEVKTVRYNFDLSVSGQPTWQDVDSETQRTTNDLAKSSISSLLKTMSDEMEEER